MHVQCVAWVQQLNNTLQSFFPIKSTVHSGHYPPPLLNNHFAGNLAGTLLHCQATNLKRRHSPLLPLYSFLKPESLICSYTKTAQQVINWKIMEHFMNVWKVSTTLTDSCMYQAHSGNTTFTIILSGKNGFFDSTG